MQLEIGEYVRILDVDKITLGEKYWNNGDITEVVGYSASDRERPKLRSTRSERYDMSLWISKHELEYVEKVTPEEARAWVIEQAVKFVTAYDRTGIHFGHIGTTTKASHDTRGAIAKCNPDDLYNVHIGKAIALARLLGKQVPTIFLHVPQVAKEDRIEVDATNFYAESIVGRLLSVEEPKKKVITHIPKRLTPLTETPFDPNEVESVTRPAHYHTGNIDVIKFSEENFSREELKGFYRINVLKYVTRYDKKDQLNDLKKARFYLNKLEELEG